jgi:chorismate dehydratase
VLRIGTVPFLVARPLTAGLAERPDVQLTIAPPSELVGLLRRGEVDIALASSILALEPDNFELWADGPVIASVGAVRSVLMLLRKGMTPKQVRRLAVDPISRTGRALADLILRDLYQVKADLIECAPTQALASTDPSFDAVQIIGDQAMGLATQYPQWQVLDLGQCWAELTGLPFVFAGWIARPGFEPSRAASILWQAAETGLAQRSTLAAEGARELGLDVAFLRRYLIEDLAYSLTSLSVRSALAEFQARLRAPVS